MHQNQEKSLTYALIRHASGEKPTVHWSGLTGSERAYGVFRLFEAGKRRLVAALPSAKEAEAFLKELQFFLGDGRTSAICFSEYSVLPAQFFSYQAGTAAGRIRTLYEMVSDDAPKIIVTTAAALLQKVIPKGELISYAELIMTDEEFERDQLVQKLLSGGYVHAMLVEEPGEFSVRGGILDVYSPLYPDPLRIEFFGDLVESIRFFSPVTQRKTDTLKEAVILPVSESIFRRGEMSRIKSRIREQAARMELPVSQLRAFMEGMNPGGDLLKDEKLLPFFYPEPDTFFDYAGDALYVMISPKELALGAKELHEKAEKNYATCRSEGRLCPAPDQLYLRWPEAENLMKRRQTLTVQTLPLSTPPPGEAEAAPVEQRHFSVETNAGLRDELKDFRHGGMIFQPVVRWMTDHMGSGMRVSLVCGDAARAEELKTMLEPYGIAAPVVNQFAASAPSGKDARIVIGELSAGFVWPEMGEAVISETEIFGRAARRKKRRKKARADFLGPGNFKPGELVVHEDHGIGRYEGLNKLTIDGATTDFIAIAYRDEDRLYLPVDRMGAVQRYVGVDGVEPVLDKMGGMSWQRTKQKVKQSVEKIAGELLNLYAKRKISQGHSFSPPDDRFREFEAGFPYEETEDQLKAIEDVLTDMQSETPMDRLICGDVGYGKTEALLRASYMAVSNGKQVAILVPTTILAEQHYSTFARRFENFPFNVACLNRFRSPAEQRGVIKGLREGGVDIVIGTHRLLSGDVQFKNLGLAAIDEEQRFGVKQKEKLKKMFSAVDLLALSATPIPRTLHLSLTGIRDISVISTPPEHRRAIKTFVCELDDDVLSQAIRNELDRKGQIFFVHNNIHSIWQMAKHIRTLVPEVRLDVAHGRMDEEELEKVMYLFINKKIDMLVSTTIIESGLDIPSANTILVNRPDRFGLAQMYQLRGRVGRADEQAYAYLLIPRTTNLTKDAEKRLKVLMEHGDLGSGFQIAMSDLKIRGGGTILGASQSGHIAAVGYDMFLKLMEDAVSEMKGEPVQEIEDAEIKMPLPAFLSDDYVPDIDQRLRFYRRLSSMTELRELSDAKAELIDRYGPLPEEAANLLLKIMLKVMSKKAGVKKLDMKGADLYLTFSDGRGPNAAKLAALVLSHPDRYALTPENVFTAKLPRGNPTAQMGQAKNILKEIIQHVNN